MPVNPVVLHAMRWSDEYAVPYVSPETGAALRLLATTTRPRAAVEVGTGLGVSGLWLLPGLPPGSMLTSIDVDADLQGMARQAYAAAGHPPARYRLITGRAEVMLGRLADGSYDLMFLDVANQHALGIEAAARLLRPDGLLIVHDPTDDDHARLAGPEWTAAPLGPRLLAATLTPADPERRSWSESRDR